MLDLSKHDCYVIASTHTDSGRDLEHHQAVCDFLYDNDHEYHVVEVVYTHISGNKVRELAFVMPAHVWEEVSTEPESWFSEQESILVLQARDEGLDHYAMLKYENEAEHLLPVMLGYWREVSRRYAMSKPAYSRHDDTYYVAE